MPNETVELFYVGDHFHGASKTMMSCIYEVGSFRRYDWGFVNIALQEGKNVNIRQATVLELGLMAQELNQRLAEQSS